MIPIRISAAIDVYLWFILKKMFYTMNIKEVTQTHIKTPQKIRQNNFIMLYLSIWRGHGKTDFQTFQAECIPPAGSEKNT